MSGKRTPLRRQRRQASAPPVGPSTAATGAPSAPVDGRSAGPVDDQSVTAWMLDGNCRLYPPATFFPSDGVGVDKARKICKGCSVLERCLEYALDNRIDHGVWGGCSERERRRILKRRRLEATPV